MVDIRSPATIDLKQRLGMRGSRSIGTIRLLMKRYATSLWRLNDFNIQLMPDIPLGVFLLDSTNLITMGNYASL